MPLIDHVDHELPLAILQGFSTLEADGVAQQFLYVTIEGVSALFASGTFIDLNGGVEIAGTSDLFALGRLNGEPNEFGVVTLAGTSGIDFAGITLLGGKAIIAGTSALLLGGTLAEADRNQFRIHLIIADLPGVAAGAVYSARIFADGVGYPIRAFQFDEGTAFAGSKLNVTLQKPSDRDAILAAGSFTFDIHDNGTWRTMFESGRRVGGQFAFAWTEGRPNDGLSVSSAGPITEKLEKSPRRNLTIYDPTREDIDADAFEGILDENGVEYEHELKRIADMRVHDLFDYVFRQRCGFTAIETTIPDDPIRRLDVGITETFNDAVAGVIGLYRPLMFVKNDVLYILDSSIALPSGFVTPVELNGNQYKNAQFNIVEQVADGYVVQYTDSDRDFDYYQDRDVDVPTAVFGNEGSDDYTETDVVITFRDFYKLSTPATPIRTEKVGQVTTVRGMLDGELQEISELTETIEFDSKFRLASIDKRKTAAIPDLSETFPIITREIRREITEFEYKPDIQNPRREILAKRSVRVTGLVMTDTANTHLDQPFRQEFYNAWRSGNFTGDGQTVDTATISTEIETTEQNARGQNEVRLIAVDYMTDPPNVHTDATSAHGGDASTNAQTASQKEVIIYRTGLTDRTNAKLQTFNGGEFRLANLKALAKRRLDQRQLRTGTIELKGLNLSFGRGTVLTLVDRDGSPAGAYIVEGRSIAGDALGTREQTTRQVLQVQEINTDGPGLTIGVAEAGAVLLNAGGTKAFTLSIECRSGYSLTAEADDANVRFWAKATVGGSFQNIHSSPIDLTPFAGTAHTFYFELRIDGAATDGDEIVSILVKRI